MPDVRINCDTCDKSSTVYAGSNNYISCPHCGARHYVGDRTNGGSAPSDLDFSGVDR